MSSPDSSSSQTGSRLSSRSSGRNSPKFGMDRSYYRSGLHSWFSRRFPQRRDLEITEIEVPLNTGFSNETVVVAMSWTEDGVSQDGRYVVRIEPRDGGMFPPQTPACEISVEVQYRAMKTVADAGVAPMPPLLGYESDPSVLRGQFFVMGFVSGRTPADVPRFSESGFVVDEATPEQRRRMVFSTMDTIAGIHSIDWRTAGLEWLDPSGVGEPTTAMQLDLYRRYAASELAGREHPVLYAALDWLDANDPGDDRIGLTWGDARLGNMIFDDYRAAAVLDWEVAALCPLDADVGWWLMFDRMSFDDLGIERLEGYPTREESVARYEQTSGRTVYNAHYWEVFATMRFCHIFVRLGDRITAAGLTTPETNPAIGNPVTSALAALLEMDNPTPDVFAL